MSSRPACRRVRLGYERNSFCFASFWKVTAAGKEEAGGGGRLTFVRDGCICVGLSALFFVSLLCGLG